MARGIGYVSRRTQGAEALDWDIVGLSAKQVIFCKRKILSIIEGDSSNDCGAYGFT